MNIPAEGFWALVEGFLSTTFERQHAERVSAGPDAARRSAWPGAPGQSVQRRFGVEDDPAASAAAAGARRHPDQTWWQGWRDGLDGTAVESSPPVAGVRAFCKWWARLFALESPVAI